MRLAPTMEKLLNDLHGKQVQFEGAQCTLKKDLAAGGMDILGRGNVYKGFLVTEQLTYLNAGKLPGIQLISQE